MNALEALETVAGEDHHHDCARLTVEYPNGEFSLEYATGTPEPGAVWNIAADPPGAPPESFAILDGGRRHVVVASEAKSGAEALAEAGDLIGAIAGHDAEIVESKTFEMFKGVRELFGGIAKTDYLVAFLAGLAVAMFVGAVTGGAYVLGAFVLGAGVTLGTIPWWSFNYQRRAV